ncbi:antibiotic biosynthesis monooxygenase [Methanobacterium sp. ACI-7]|uniref:antibiotic biosynthesis monooxygenase n=1 Tax=unclassified Methanobacterium TaxID=2627676 RepID=UPI0039C2FC20
MVYILVNLKLESYDKWKSLFNERATIRQESGSYEAHLFRNSEDFNEVTILFKWDNFENARNYFESESLQKALKNGSTQEITITYLDEIAKTI